MSVFCDNLKRFRMARNMTQEQAAEALGVSTQTVSRWECNTTLPDVMILPRIAELYCTVSLSMTCIRRPAWPTKTTPSGC